MTAVRWNTLSGLAGGGWHGLAVLVVLQFFFLVGFCVIMFIGEDLMQDGRVLLLYAGTCSDFMWMGRGGRWDMGLLSGEEGVGGVDDWVCTLDLLWRERRFEVSLSVVVGG